jgi:hypothetical protein
MFKIGSHDPFEHLKHKLWPKEKPGIKLVVWLPTTKSRESTLFPHVQVACDILLESSQWGIQLFFRPHCNRRFARKVMGRQSCESPNCGNSGTPTWESRDKMPFGCGLHGEACPSTPQSVASQGACFNSLIFRCLHFSLTFESIKEPKNVLIFLCQLSCIGFLLMK